MTHRTKSQQRAHDEAVKAERERITEIQKAAKTVGASDEKINSLIDRGVTAAQARTELLGDFSAGRIGRGVDARDNFVAGATNALLARSGVEQRDPQNPYSSYSLSGLAKEAARSSGADIQRMRSVKEAVGAALCPMAYGGHTTSDFTKVLENIANKQMLRGWEEAAETFQQWTRPGELPDFKPASRAGLGIFDDLDEIPDGGEYNYGSFGDYGETIQLATYGKMFGISRRAIINDDLAALSRAPFLMGRAAARTIGNLAYAVLTSNPQMADGHDLFDATNHNNAATSAALGVDTLDAGRVAMANQKDPDEKTDAGLNIRPSYLVVPVALESQARVLMESQFKPGGNANDINTVNGLAQIVSDARLDANSATTWYLLADPMLYDTVEVAYLNGVQTPYLEQQDSWNVDGSQFKVRIDAGVKALDHRGAYRGEA